MPGPLTLSPSLDPVPTVHLLLALVYAAPRGGAHLFLERRVLVVLADGLKLVAPQPLSRLLPKVARALHRRALSLRPRAAPGFRERASESGGLIATSTPFILHKNQ